MSSSFQKRLVEAMQIRDMTQADLVKATGLSKPRISQYVNGTYEAKQQALYALSKALNVNITWLMGNDVPMEIDYEKLHQEVNTCEQIEKTYGKEALMLIRTLNQVDKVKFTEVISMYSQLDALDQAEIRGEMKQMLKSDKYSTNKKVIGISQQKEKPDVIIGQIAAFGSGPADIPVDKEASQKLAVLAKKKRDEKKGK